MTCDFVKLGKFTYSVAYRDRFYVHKAISRRREEPLPFHDKLLDQLYREDFAVFDHPQKPDAYACFEHDARHWQLGTFITNHNETMEVNTYL